LEEDLKRRQEELHAKLDGIDDSVAPGLSSNAAQDADSIVSRQREVNAMKKRIRDQERRALQAASEIDESLQVLRDVETRLESLRGEHAESSRGVAKQQKGMERYLSKKQRLIEQREKCNKSIRDLGVLPEEAFEDEKYSTMKSDRVRTSR
jgi:structural maintenance of chromosome 3 (chondroitin sulfate proteoglycan 6)